MEGYRQPCNESLIMNNSVFDITHGEDIETKPILTDTGCEELTFPLPFPNGKLGYSCIRKTKLSWSE